MKILGLEISWARKSDGISIDTIIRRLEAVYATSSGVAVTPDSAMRSPTVHAIVTAVSRRISTLPIHIYRKTTSNGRASKEILPDHPVARLLRKPNDWQTSIDFWADAASTLVRWGNFYAFKARGSTGPIRRIIPFDPGCVQVKQDDETLDITYEVRQAAGRLNTYDLSQMVHARGPARNFYCGNSPVMDVREAIALEVAAEQMGSSVFGNGAMPGVVFQHAATSAGFKTAEERTRFIEDFATAYSKRDRFKAMLLPKGIELGQQIEVQNEKAQFLETRQHQRTVIAGAFGVPPHLVGDLSKGTFNNVEAQSIEFIQQVILPYVRIFEAAMERDLLTDEDRAKGVIIRFNLEAALRGDFQTRQNGLNIMRQAGVLNANEWREHEGMNPISDNDGGEEYWRRGPSGQSAAPATSRPRTSSKTRNRGRKTALGLSRFERQTAQLEGAMNQIAEEVLRAVAEADDNPSTARRELADLGRRVARIASTAQDIAASVESARDTLVMLDTVGVGDAAADDEALNAIAERLDAIERQASDAADTIGAALDEIEEAGVRSQRRPVKA